MTNVVDLTQKSIRCASVTPEDNGAQDVLKTELENLGFEIVDLPFEGNGSYPVKNFFARRGTGSPHICYAGHTDVVPTGDESLWSHPPFSGDIDGDILYGRGTSDMKGANCAFVTAAADFIQNNLDFKGSISFLITGDEEADAINGTIRVLEWMKENNHIPDVCLVGESSNASELGQAIRIGRRGSMSGTLSVRGKQGHVANPHLADNPLPRLSRMAAALSEIEFDKGNDDFPPTNLEVTSIDVDNKATNVIPSHGSLNFNVRFNTEWTLDTLEKKIREALDKVSPDYQLETSSNALPFLTDNKEWTRLVRDVVAKHTGQTPDLNTGGGTSDARFIAPYCAVVEFGLTLETIHQIDEHCRISDLEKLVIIYQDILSEYFSS